VTNDIFAVCSFIVVQNFPIPIEKESRRQRSVGGVAIAQRGYLIMLQLVLSCRYPIIYSSIGITLEDKVVTSTSLYGMCLVRKWQITVNEKFAITMTVGYI